MTGAIAVADIFAPIWLANTWLPGYPAPIGFGEMVGGATDGVNTVFTVATVPNPPSIQLVYGATATAMGSVLLVGVHYTLVDVTITTIGGFVPANGSWLRAWYRTGG